MSIDQSENRPEVKSGQESKWQSGYIAKGMKGRIGEVIGQEEVSGLGSYVRIRFAEGNESLFPIAKVGELFTFTPHQYAQIPDGETMEQFLAEAEGERLHNIAVDTLRGYIRQKQTYSAEEIFAQVAKPEFREVIKAVLEKAKQHDMVFRGDGRHPLAKSKYDREIGAKEGIFETGFGGSWIWNEGDIVYTSADLDRACAYPDSSHMPPNWDNTRYLYFIDPTPIFDNVESITPEDIHGNQIVSGKIPGEFVPFAFEIQQKSFSSSAITEVFVNPNARVNKPKLPNS